MNIYDRIKELCESLNVTIKDVEKAAKLPNSSIVKWKDSIPSADKLYRVASFFGVTVEYLLGEGENSQSTAFEQSALMRAYRRASSDGKLKILQAAIEVLTEEQK